jgi:O-antigen/teichoic acid export membrane protein
MAAIILFYFIWINIDNVYALMPQGEYYEKGKWVVLIIGFTRLIDALGASASPILANSPYYAWALINFLIAALAAIIANALLIPRFGITGAAFGTVITFFCTQSFAVILLYSKLKIQPFNGKILTLFIIFLIMLGLSFTGQWITHPILDSCCKSLILGGSLLYLLYAFHISQEVNSLADKYLSKITGNRIRRLPRFY